VDTPGAGREGATWRAIAASVAGSSHRAANRPNQDVARYAVLPSGALILAVADGAGSAPRAADGATTAAEAALAHLRRAQLDVSHTREAMELAVAEACAAAQAALEDQAARCQAPLADFHCTLTVGLAVEDEVTVGQIGDGVVVVQLADGTLQTMVRPRRGEYANETWFLAQPGALEDLVVATAPGPIRALAVMTDGLLRLAQELPAHEPHAAFYRPLFAFLAGVSDLRWAEAELAAFVASKRVAARTDDDRTLLLAVRAARGGS